MRLQMLLPKVEPATFTLPMTCPHPGCPGTHFQERQEVNKAVRDTVHQHVVARRYACLRCQRTFRVYPLGVTRAQVSLRVKGLAVMFYLLGLSYGAVSLVLDALGVYLCKSRVYEVVQAAARCVPGLKRQQVFQDVRTPALGCDITSVRCNGRWLPLGVTVDDTTGWVLTIDELSGEDAQTLTEWIVSPSDCRTSRGQAAGHR